MQRPQQHGEDEDADQVDGADADDEERNEFEEAIAEAFAAAAVINDDAGAEQSGERERQQQYGAANTGALDGRENKQPRRDKDEDQHQPVKTAADARRGLNDLPEMHRRANPSDRRRAAQAK